jgi:predicted nuclease with TOPRIM domain
VALAAIQGLAARHADLAEHVDERDARLDDLRAEMEELRNENERLHDRLSAIEARLDERDE